MMSDQIVMGAVAYDPKVVTIWNGFREWFWRQDFSFDYVLYSNYERQVEDLVEGKIDAAWNSPLAWIRTDRLATSIDEKAQAIAMRDSDRDLHSLIVVKSDSPVQNLSDLQGKTIATGAIDSPQGLLLPIDHLRRAGVAIDSISLSRFDVGVGLHGDHVGGERDAAKALIAGQVDAACMLDASHLTFSKEGTLPSGSTRVLGETVAFDHCNMSTIAGRKVDAVQRFADLLFSMSFEDPEVRPLLDLEGLTKWLPGRTALYDALEQAVDAMGFYDQDGSIAVSGYRP